MSQAASVCAALLLGLAPAAAHHSRGASRIGPASTVGGLQRAGVPAAARLRLALDHALSRFDRTLRGTDTYTADQPVAVDAHTLRLGVAVDLPTGTSVQVGVPLALLRRTGAITDHTWGLADLDLEVSQSLRPLWPDLPDRLEVRVSGGLILPTGAEREAPVGTATELGGDFTEVRLTTHEMRAALGAGAWWLQGGVGLRLRLSEGLGLGLDGRVRAPVDAAADGTRWGLQVESELVAQGALAAGRLQVRAGLGHRHRGVDRRPPVPPEGDGVVEDPEAAPTGGAQAWRVVGGVAWRLAGATWLQAAVDVPVHQRVEGVQLVETFSAQLGVEIGFGGE